MLTGRRLINKALHFNLTFLPTPKIKQKLYYITKTKPGKSILPVSIETTEEVVVHWSTLESKYICKFNHQRLISFSDKNTPQKKDFKY